MDSGLAAPDFGRHSLSNRSSIVDDVVETGFTAFILSNSLSADESGAPTWLQRVVRDAKPVCAEVRHLRHTRESFVHFARVCVAMFFRQPTRAKIGRVTDYRVGLRPGG